MIFDNAAREFRLAFNRKEEKEKEKLFQFDKLKKEEITHQTVP